MSVLRFTVVAFLLIVTCRCSTDSGSTSAGSQYLPNITSNMAAGLPSGFKTGGSTPGTRSFGLLPFVRAAIGLGDPIGSADKSTFPNLGNVLWLVWNLQYGTTCTDAEMSAGTCFRVHPSTSSSEWNYYKRPAPLDDSTICRSTSEIDTLTIGNSMVSQACVFENTLIQKGTLVDSCYNSVGTAGSLTSYIPWATTNWGLPASLKFQGAFSYSNLKAWFGINRDVTGENGQYMLSLDTYMDGSMKFIYLDRANNKFISHGSTNTGFMTYLGELPSTDGGSTTGSFEALQALEYTSGPNSGTKFTIRMKSNGQYVWLQSWNYVPGDSEFDASNPSSNNGDVDWCLKLATNIPSSYYVAQAECLTAFGKASAAAMNADSNFTLKLAGISKSNWFQAGSTVLDPNVNPITQTVNTCFP